MRVGSGTYLPRMAVTWPHQVEIGARCLLEADISFKFDGIWREAALTYDRSFFLFDATKLEDARLAWKLLSGRDGVERRYWANENGKWVKKA